jgi:hypothetical protein
MDVEWDSIYGHSVFMRDKFLFYGIEIMGSNG